MHFMQSDGGLTPMSSFSGSRAILSGPAGGVVKLHCIYMCVYFLRGMDIILTASTREMLIYISTCFESDWFTYSLIGVSLNKPLLAHSIPVLLLVLSIV